MADDGMLLNFELPSDALAPRLSFKGGNWKDRLIAKKKAVGSRLIRSDRRQDESINISIPVQSNGSHTGDRPFKRRRLSGSEYVANHNDQPRSHGNKVDSSTRSLPSKSVTSSLFTYNPASSAAREAVEPEVDEDVVPSNAPMNDGLASFIQLGVSEVVANHLVKKMNVTAPTAIQRKALRHLCSNFDDAFIQAQTGSGKTLSYLLPIVQHITNISRQMKASGRDFARNSGLFAIVLAPTRELSKQIASVLETLLSCFPFIICGTVIGGESKKSEKARLRKGINILVATPGRMADHIEHTEAVDVSRVRWLVLDEGDTLMERGFENDIQKLIGTLNLRATKHQSDSLPGLPSRRTTILCSATIKPDVEQLRNIALKDAVSISVDADPDSTADAEEQAFSAPAQLRQSYAIVPAKQRLVTLIAVLKQAFKRKGSVMKAIVFISCADSVDYHFDVLTHDDAQPEKEDVDLPQQPSSNAKHKPISNGKKGSIAQGLTISEKRTSAAATMFGGAENPVTLYRLHGSLQQATRTSTLKAFSQSTTPALLVCTDVASRGLDLPNIELIIELDPSFSKEDHLHRVGRTARAGNDGRALIFLQPGCEESYVQILKETKPRSITRHDADELLRKAFTFGSGTAHSWQDQATEWQLNVERWVIDNPHHHEQAMRAFQSHVRAYATHVAAERSMFDIKQLHLGHLAKAFALREKPGDIKVPGLRPGKDTRQKSKSERRIGAAQQSIANNAQDSRKSDNSTDEQSARRKMQAKARFMLGGASEFNLG